MNKTARKLVPAIFMLVIAMVFASTSSYAWFSMNKTVTATGMNVTAKSNTTYLLISKTKVAENAPSAANIQAENEGKGNLTVSLATDSATALYPVAHGTVASAENKTVTSITAGTGVTTFSWYTMNGTNADDGTGAAKTAEQVTDGLENYYLKYTLYFTVAAGANAAKDLVVSSCTIKETGKDTAGDTAIRCLVVGAANSVEFSATTAGSATVLAASLTNSTVVSVDVYVFYDGNAGSHINTNDIASILGTTIDLEFTCKEATES